MKKMISMLLIIAMTLTSVPTVAANGGTSERIERSEALYEELFGGMEMSLYETDPDFVNIMNRFIYGDVYYQSDTLDIRQRQLITLVSLTVNPSPDLLRANVQSSLNAGLNPIEIKEAIYQCAPYIGFGRVYDAITAVNEVFEENGITLPLESQRQVEEDERYDAGRNLQINLYNMTNPPENRRHINDYLAAYCFGDIYTRDGIELKTRQLLTLCILANLGTEAQIRGHIQGSINVGYDKDTIFAAITQCTPYMGFPRTLNALNLLNEMMPDEEPEAETGAADNVVNDLSESVIFPLGTKNESGNFIGDAWAEMIVAGINENNCTVGNVTFAPGARNKWHIHPGGQILLVTGGTGYHQIEGEPVQVLSEGDVAICPPGAKHWHGAAPDSWFVHVAIGTNTDMGGAEWLEPVTDEEYYGITAE